MAKESHENLMVPWTSCDLSHLHRGKNCRHPGHTCVLFGAMEETIDIIAYVLGGIRSPTAVCRGVRACGEHPRTLGQEASLVGESLGN